MKGANHSTPSERTVFKSLETYSGPKSATENKAVLQEDGTMAPTTYAPTTMAPTTMAPTTMAPSTLAPSTESGLVPGSYFMVPGEDCGQGDLPMAGRFEQTLDSCIAECNAIDECVGFSFRESSADCYLKGTANCATNRDPNGILVGFNFYAQTPAYTMLEGDCATAEVPTPELEIPAAATIQECAGYCAAVSECAGFSFSSTATPSCILRSASCTTTTANGDYMFYSA